MAEQVSAVYGRTVTADNVATLVDHQFRPLGLLLDDDGSEPALQEGEPAARRCGSSTRSPTRRGPGG